MALVKKLQLSKEVLSYLFTGYNPFVRHINAEGDFMLSLAQKKDCTKIIVVVETLQHKWSRLVSELVLVSRKGIFPVEFITHAAIGECDLSTVTLISYKTLDQGTRDSARLAVEIADQSHTQNAALFSGRFLDTGKYITLYDREVSQAICTSQNRDLKIQAIVTCYNEQDIIGHTVQYLVDQGIHVHVIDNWSTDDSRAVIEQFVREHEIVTSEKFPKDGPSETYDWEQILTQVQNHAMAHHSEFDWFVHHDADEVRESPFQSAPGLAEGIGVAHACGYNLIDHTVINFVPIPDGYDGSQDITAYLQYYSFGNTFGDAIQIKAWKSSAQVDLISKGGHRVLCSGRNEKIFPYKFLLRHYSLRSQEQATRKIFRDRLPRWNTEERKKDWHAHYNDIIEEGLLPKWDKSDYTLFERDNFYTENLVEALSGLGVERVTTSNEPSKS